MLWWSCWRRTGSVPSPCRLSRREPRRASPSSTAAGPTGKRCSGTLVPLAMQAILHEDTGSYRDDMIAFLNGWAAFFASRQGAIGPAIVGAMPHDAELAEAFRTGAIGWRKQEMAAVIERGITRGEVREDVRRDTGDPITPDLVAHIVDHIVIPYTTREGSPPPHGWTEGSSPDLRRAARRTPRGLGEHRPPATPSARTGVNANGSAHTGGASSLG